ncbi:hypothetical protein GCM10029978_067760 [Actinoallomurus acanthiterrae]
MLRVKDSRCDSGPKHVITVACREWADLAEYTAEEVTAAMRACPDELDPQRDRGRRLGREIRDTVPAAPPRHRQETAQRVSLVTWLESDHLQRTSVAKASSTLR